MTSATPFPGMDPYLEHQLLWPGFHTALIVEIRKQLIARLRPRYAVSIEERTFLDVTAEERIPDVIVRKRQRERRRPSGGIVVAGDAPGVAAPIVVDAEPLEIRERYLEILDAYEKRRMVTVIEVVSPTNKRAGPGRETYRRKQEATIASKSHLVEIDLLRKGRHTLSIPRASTRRASPYDYLICVNRYPVRTRYELYPISLRNRLPKFHIPLADPDPDALLDLQAAFEQVYEDGSYAQLVKYDKPCTPRLLPDDQAWASKCWQRFRAEHPELFRPVAAPID